MQAALEQILGRDQAAPEVLRYEVPTDFNTLWKACDSDPTVSKLRSSIVIIWDSTPSDDSLDPIRCENVLSPIDWAVAYVTKFKEEETWPKILILNLQPDTNASVPLYRQFLQMRRELFPWLRVFVAPSVGAACSSTVLITLKHILDFIDPQALGPETTTCRTDGFSVPREKRAELIAAHESLLRSARSNLTESGPKAETDRHAIANIIGPIVLLGEMPIKNEIDDSGSFFVQNGKHARFENCKTGADHKQALRLLFKCVDLLHRETSSITSGKKILQNVLPVLPEGYKLRITLVDDQWQNGWLDWLKAILPDGTVFTVCPDPFFVLSRVEDALSGNGDAKDGRFALDLAPPNAPKSGYIDILLLDLRLFQGDAALEKRFTSKIEELFGRLNLRIEPGKKNISQQLTLLPKLIASSDFSFPVVLFSSTTMRSIVSELRSYRSIVTDFAKPTQFSPEAIDDGFYAKFASSIVEALKWADLRFKCKALLSLKQQDQKPDEKRERLYIELFVDETRTTKSGAFEVGGVFAIFDSRESADLFDDAAVAAGLRYFDGTLFPPFPSPARILQKNSDTGSAELAQVFKLTTPLPIGFVQLRRGNLQRDSETTEEQDDTQFHTLLTALIELFIAESIPQIADHYRVEPKHINLSVYAATRMTETADSGDHTYQRTIEVHHFGTDNKIRSLGNRDVFPLVRAALRLHKIGNMAIERSTGVCLPYQGEAKDRIDRVINRATRTVRNFNLSNDVDVVNPSGARVCGIVEKIAGADPSRLLPPQYMFVRVPGGGEIFCHRKRCADFDQFRPGEHAELEIITGHDGRPQGNNVRYAAESDFIAWLSTQTTVVANWFLRGAPLDQFRPDYRALHYVSDQVMRHGCKEFAAIASTESLPGQFDENFEIPLQTSLNASRRLDEDRLGEALRLFVFDPLPSRKYERPAARILIGRRIASKLASASCDQIAANLPDEPFQIEKMYSAEDLWSPRRPSLSKEQS